MAAAMEDNVPTGRGVDGGAVGRAVRDAGTR